MADDKPSETTLAEVLHVLARLTAAGVRYWLEGGWGVDALVGRQTRPHRDVDVDVDAASGDVALSTLAELGYRIEEDWRPNRVQLLAPDRGRVDLHPLILDPDGRARQAALGGGFHMFQPSYFTMGSLAGVAIPCVSAAAQRVFHQGYDLRPVDVADLRLLDGLDL